MFFAHFLEILFQAAIALCRQGWKNRGDRMGLSDIFVNKFKQHKLFS